MVAHVLLWLRRGLAREIGRGLQLKPHQTASCSASYGLDSLLSAGWIAVLVVISNKMGLVQFRRPMSWVLDREGLNGLARPARPSFKTMAMRPLASEHLQLC